MRRTVDYERETGFMTGAIARAFNDGLTQEPRAVSELKQNEKQHHLGLRKQFFFAARLRELFMYKKFEGDCIRLRAYQNKPKKTRRYCLIPDCRMIAS